MLEAALFLNYININIIRIKNFLSQNIKTVNYLAHECLNVNNCWPFNIYEQFKVHAQIS